MRQVILLLGIMWFLSLWIFPLDQSEAKTKEGIMPKVKYTVISQRWLSQVELNRFKDVQGLVSAVRMRLSNESDWYVQYIARSTGSILPQGYHFFHKVGDTKWQSLPPIRGREGELGPEFKGDGYKWLELAPGAAIEFEMNCTP